MRWVLLNIKTEILIEIISKIIVLVSPKLQDTLWKYFNSHLRIVYILEYENEKKTENRILCY